MDGFYSYNQIKIAPEDQKKIAFICVWGNFYWNVMPFGLKNVDTTYQRAVTTIFHDKMPKTMDDYVDDTLVKSAKMQHSPSRFVTYPRSHGKIQSKA